MFIISIYSQKYELFLIFLCKNVSFDHFLPNKIFLYENFYDFILFALDYLDKNLKN